METYVHAKTCTRMFITALFTIAQSGNKPDVHRTITDKYIHTMEYYWAKNRTEVLTYTVAG